MLNYTWKQLEIYFGVIPNKFKDNLVLKEITYDSQLINGIVGGLMLYVTLSA